MGELLSFMVTPGNVDDREPLKNKTLVEQLFGKLVGDKGYISKDIFSKLFVDGIQLITKLRNNMKGQIMTLGDKILLRKRAIIETINDELKNIAQIEHSRHRSVTGFTVNLMAGLAAYSYSGNQLTSSTYDSNGNMTYDVTSGLTMEWNHLDLIKKVSNNSGVLINYTYLSDGTKVRSVDASGEGLEYRGSSTFRRSSDGTLTPESIAFPGGRFIAMQGADGSIQMVPNYHIADHLGSVRTIVDGSTGQVIETNDYYAFGGRWDRSGSLIDQSNRYRFNGKEEQVTGDIGLTDYGARFYDSSGIRWTTPDPLAEKYYGISPYVFCNNSPVNFVDPDGRKLYFAKGVSDKFKRQFAATVKFMNSKGTAGDLAKLHSSETIYYIGEINKGQKHWNHFNPNNQTILWDPNTLFVSNDGIYVSPATTLAHEAAHAARYDEVLNSADPNAKTEYEKSSQSKSNDAYGSDEEERVITTVEQYAARKHGEIRNDQVTRTNHYEGHLISLPNEISPSDLSKMIFEHNNLL